MAHVAPIRPIQLSEERLLAVYGKPSVVEAGASSTLFPCEN
jgi:hypothetical protein